MRPRRLTSEQVEVAATARLAGYERWLGQPIAAPVPIDHIIEAHLGLMLEYEPIAAVDGRTIVSQITQPAPGRPARVVVNSTLEALLAANPAMERAALAHELGHHDLHLDHSVVRQLALDLGPGVVFRTPASSPAGIAAIFNAERQRAAEADDDFWREWQAWSYARFLLLPRRLLGPRIADCDLCEWRNLYPLAEAFGVSISLLRIHLEKLGYVRLAGDRLRPGPLLAAGRLPLRPGRAE